jgi:hypothetical protein
MRRLFTVMVLLAACHGQDESEGLDAKRGEVVQDIPDKEVAVRVRLSFDGKAAIVKLHDNPTSRDLLGRLPLELKLSDYANIEKIAYLPNKPSTEYAPSGFEPSAGDVTYYAPWGNLAIFYKGFGFADGLVRLGVVESGLKELAACSGDVTVRIERVKDAP